MRFKIMFGVVLTALLSASISFAADKEYKAYIVSNAHLDTQWNWDIRTTIDEYVYNTVVRNLFLLKAYPDYVFNFEGGVKYSWMKEYYPAEYQEMKRYIAQGRWHISGASWDANDPNMPSTESFFKNILLGQQFYKKEFGVASTDIFLPDCFGFGYTLPTVAAHAGLIGFSTQKLQWRNNNFHGNSKVPFNIGLWQGVDGSRIMAALDGKPYVHQWNGEDISRNGEIINMAKEGTNKTAMRYYGTGDTGGSPNIGSMVSLAKGIKSDGPVQIISATSDQLFKDYLPYENHPELPVYDGELLMDVHATGCYTSQAAMKLYNKRNEQLGDAAERISVMANYLDGAAYPDKILNESWKMFIWHQFHDDLTGTSLPKAYTYSWNDELIAQSRFANVIHTGVGSVASSMDTRVTGTPVVIYNPMASVRNESVEITIDAPKNPAGVRIFNANGKEVLGQIIKLTDGKATIRFSASAEPVSCSVYDIRFEKSTARTSLKASGNTIENAIYKLTLDQNGDIASIVDKRYGRELVKQDEPVRLALFTDNESFEWPAWEIHKKTMDAKPVGVNENVKITVDHKGSGSAALKVERYYGKSRFVQYIRMTEGGCDDRIDIVNEVDWDTQNALLKAEFPMNVANEKATYDLGIGTIRRGNNTKTAYEVYAQQWADITDVDNSYGVSILNDCKYGWDKPNDHTLRLTLLHTPKVKDRYKYQEKQDLGHHTFTFSIVGHKGALSSDVCYKAESLNAPLAAYATDKHNGALGRSFSLIEVNTPQVAVRSFKKAEDSDMYVVRLYELNGADAKNVEVAFASEIESAYETNGVEDKIGPATIKGNKLCFDMTSYRPKTFAVKLKSGKVRAVASADTHLALPYNENAFTPDHFGYLGQFDKDGNSYSADLISDVVVSDNVTFKIAQMDQNNVVKCDGDTIQLPQSDKSRKLYLLVASTTGDRVGEFIVDGKSYKMDVPYYSGFYGQWGQTDFSKGYIKNTPIAYVGTHRHTRKGNESYIFTYMYKLAIPLPQGARTVVLPKDKNIAVFAATVSNNYTDNVTSVNELRALPVAE